MGIVSEKQESLVYLHFRPRLKAWGEEFRKKDVRRAYALRTSFFRVLFAKPQLMDENQNAVQLDGIRGRCGFPNYLRRDATALRLILLSMMDITSSFL